MKLVFKILFLLLFAIPTVALAQNDTCTETFAAEGHDDSNILGEFLVVYENGLWKIEAENEEGNKTQIIPPTFKTPFIYTDEFEMEATAPMQLRDFIILLGKENQPDELWTLAHENITPKNAFRIYPCALDSFAYTFETKSGEYGYLDNAGKIAFPPISKTLPMPAYDGLWLVKSTQGYYLANPDGSTSLAAVDMDYTNYEALLLSCFEKEYFPYTLSISNYNPSQGDKLALLKYFIFGQTGMEYENIADYFDNYLSEIDNGIDVCLLHPALVETIEVCQQDDNYGCWPPWYGTFEKNYYSLSEIIPGIAEYLHNAETYGHGHGDVNEFSYAVPDSTGWRTLTWEDYFTETEIAKDHIHKYVKRALNNTNKEDFMVEPEEPIQFELYATTQLSFDKDGMTVWVDYFEMGSWQYPVKLPWEEIAGFIPKNSALHTIRASEYSFDW